MAKANKIQTPAQRDKLPVRREPYWSPLPMAGGYLGYRRTVTGGSWVARYRSKAGKQLYYALKLPFDVPPDEARDRAAKEAQKWIEQTATGAVKYTAGGYKVSDAAVAYVKNLRARKGDSAADDAEGRINRKIKGSTLWDKRVDRLTKGDIEDWLHSLVPSGKDEEATRKAKDSANRNLTTLKALLNHAWETERVAHPGPWGKVAPYEDVASARRVFLDLAQRRRLLQHCQGVFKDLVEAGMLTGARYGELRLLKVHDFDKVERCLEIRKGKTGGRTVALNDAAHSFFSRVSKDKLPNAPLLPREDGEHWAHSDQDELMREAVKAARLPKGTVFYTLRHSFIASALRAGIDIGTIAKNCGTSVRIIERNYDKFIPKDVGARLNAVSLT